MGWGEAQEEVNLSYNSLICQRTVEIREAEKERAKEKERFLNSPRRRWEFHWHWYNSINYKPASCQRFAEITVLPTLKVVLNRKWNELGNCYGVELIDHDLMVMFKFWRFVAYVKVETWLE